jgi:hypothetical protein
MSKRRAPRGLSLDLELSGKLSGWQYERRDYKPRPTNALPTRYPTKARLGDIHIDISRQKMDADADAKMQEWLKTLSPAERELLSR